MTIPEARAAGIQRVRKPVWGSPDCYLRLATSAGQHGPWAYLFDRLTQEAIGAETPQVVPSWALGDESDWEPYAGPLDATDGCPWSEIEEGEKR